MNYLLPEDFEVSIKTDNLNMIVQNDPNLLSKAERIAIEEIKSYLTARYDVDTEFKSFSEFDISKDYQHNDKVFVNGSNGNSYYYNISFSTSGTAGIELNNTNVWTTEDKRNPLIIEKLVDMTLYKLHSRVTPKQIPVTRKDNYTAAINFFNSAMHGDITLSLPERGNEAGYSVRYGTNSVGKRSNFF